VNVPLIVAGSLAILGAAVHGVGDEVLVVRKLSPGMLASSRFGGPRTTKTMIHVTWPHDDHAFLTVGSALLLSGSVLHGDTARGIGLVAAGASTGFAAVAVGLGLPTRDPRDPCSATPVPPCSSPPRRWRGGELSEEDACCGDCVRPPAWPSMNSGGERAAALVFLRHYLCVQCRVGSMELERDRHLLESVVGRDGHACPGPGLQAADGRHRARSPLPDMTAYDAMDLRRGAFARCWGSPPSAWPGGAPGLERAAASGTGRSDTPNRTGTSPGLRSCSPRADGSCRATARHTRATIPITASPARRSDAPAPSLKENGLKANTTIRPRAGRRSAHDADM
jgi:hypothetical protein